LALFNVTFRQYIKLLIYHYDFRLCLFRNWCSTIKAIKWMWYCYEE
jgi:hypothetical protein